MNGLSAVAFTYHADMPNERHYIATLLVQTELNPEKHPLSGSIPKELQLKRLEPDIVLGQLKLI